MQRTPPPSQKMPSDSDAPTASETEKQAVAVPKGHKRRRVADGLNDSLSTLKKDLTDLIDSKFKKLDDHILELKEQNTEACKWMEFMSTKHDEMKHEIASLKQEKEKDRNYIKELETKLEISDKLSKSSSIELRNVPKRETENKADLLKVAASLGTSLNLDLKKSEIDDIYRINPKSEKNSIVLLKLTTVIRKEEIMRAVKKYNRDHSTKLSSQQLGIGPPTVPVFVAEHLTPKTRRLFFLARDYARSNNYAFCWCSHGRIFLRKKEGAPQILVQDEIQLDALKSKETATRAAMVS